LPRGMDGLIKKHFDKYRSSAKLPPELEGKINARPVGQEMLDRWRNWRTGLRYEEEGVSLIGALDECFLEGEVYIPVDYKTRGYELKDNTAGYYQNQLDVYTLLLQKNGFKTNNVAYLVFYVLESLSDNGMARFDIQLIKIDTDTQKAYKVFKEAGGLLQRASPPQKNPKCKFCSWAVINLNSQ
jgi:CRISPR/Cas system-associated exonuclease Cas4 (RecB family)